VTAIDVRRVAEERDDLVRAFTEVRAVTDRELAPNDPPAPEAEVRGELFAGWSHERRLAWVGAVDGEPAGLLVVRVDDAEENRQRADVEWLAVVPHRRRLGLGDALLRAAVDWAEGDGRTSLTLGVPVLPHGAGEAFAARMGAEVVFEERCSRLRLAELDRAVVDGWRHEGSARTDGYRLVRWTGPIPEEHLDLMVTVRRAMQDAPTGDLDHTVPSLDPDDLRSFDASVARRGLLPVVTAAVSPAGDPAGYSALFVNRHRPQLAWQGDTGVLAAHRGRGLGRWLKAENLERALEVEPRIEVVETYNAESNPWMLDINVAMGFRPHVGFRAWQAATADVRAALGA